MSISFSTDTTDMTSVSFCSCRRLRLSNRIRWRRGRFGEARRVICSILILSFSFLELRGRDVSFLFVFVVEAGRFVGRLLDYRSKLVTDLRPKLRLCPHWSIVRSCEESAEEFERSLLESRVEQPTRDPCEVEEEILSNFVDLACRDTFSRVAQSSWM